MSPLSVIPLTSERTEVKGRHRAGVVSTESIHHRSLPAILNLSQRSLFLALYAKLLVGEKRRDEDAGGLLGPSDQAMVFNDQLRGITGLLETWFAEREKHGEHERLGRSQGWLEYMYGVAFVKAKNEEQAIRWLIKSVNLFPWHWGAWQELGNLIVNAEQLNQIQHLLPRTITAVIFHFCVSQELYQSTEDARQGAKVLETVFSNSNFLKIQSALVHFHNKDLNEAESIFADIIRNDPHCLDGLHHYSNLLHFMHQRPKLALLAQLGTSVDQYRPESCCAIGNYYSRIAEHEKAVVYFRRALTLDRRFPSAWTFLGHEYTALQNTHTAIESYRRAVDVDRKDYRAWYGLGQAYTSMELHSYALYYYQRASTLRPYDAAMWRAIGQCFGVMDRYEEAIKALTRALLVASCKNGSLDISDLEHERMDPETLYEIAQLHEQASDFVEAVAYMELCVAQDRAIDSEVENHAVANDHTTNTAISRARAWLVRWRDREQL
ncbi:MAG: hypothetical protein M4579_004607 [Chaenotheca gracillima]|nr:MAG: hypothetical protein M4579_004607 [Chaenotheca gracillima]